MLKWLPILLLACAPDPIGPEAADPGECSAGVTETWVLTQVTFPRAEDGVTSGFDLDEHVTEIGDREGCGVGDYVASDGTEGIDNAFALLRPALDATEASAMEEIVQEAINGGGLLAIIEVMGIDDWSNDTCVDLSVTSGLGVPLIGTDGFIVPSQTFDQDPDASISTVTRAQISNGIVVDGPIDLALPFTFLDADVVFHLMDGMLSLELHEDGTASGLIGGGVDINEISDLAHNTGIGVEVEALLDAVLQLNADLAPDENGDCTQLSFSLEFEAAPAFLYQDL